ncbi:MAG: L,D-transpeptidase family protein, partial [Pseudomonadota bacterium]
VEAALENLAPPYPCYQGLRTAYESLLPEMGKPVLPKVTGVSMLRPGSRGPAVGRLQVRLAALGYLPENQPEDAPFFGPRTEEAVRRFQEDHRLSADGLAGPTTLETINADPADRARTIAVNLERWRWLPHDLGRRYILVNTADFSLKVVEDGKTVLAMRAIVGKPYRRTPVFSARMTYMVLAPYWNVPPKIAIHDKLPLIRKDPAWLSENHMRVFSGWGAESREVDPAEVNWKALPVGRFPYHLRQDPGPGNALGTMKFMFPNKYNVYIHDTPAHELFDKAQRAFSSGCIRIQEPMKLALYLQRTDPRWNEESLGKVIEAGVETTVSLPEPLPVHVLYWTAWVDEAGELVFRPDLYGRDEVLAQALFTPHPNIQEAP